METRVLAIDDDESTRRFLRLHFEERGCDVIEASFGEEGLSKLDRSIDLVLLDYRLPDVDGLFVLEEIRKRQSEAVVLFMSAHSTVRSAVAAMREGAFHYAEKPLDLAEMEADLGRALELAQLRRELREIRSKQAEPYSIDQLIGRSKAMEATRGLLTKLAQSPNSTVLITGESGTGKDLAAKVLHYNSTRSAKPFMNITCSAMPEALLESQLFGHERGAFTDAKEKKTGLFELADGGTVFLDEIGDMPLALQAKLLRVLEDKSFMRVGGSRDVTVNVRIVAATNRDLEKRVAEGEFRSDLFFRLRVMPLEMPALRDREGDMELLVSYFIDRFNNESGKRVRFVEPDALTQLARYPWPGNVRELRNAVERAVILSESDRLRADDFLVLSSPLRALQEFRLPEAGVDLEQLERSLLVQALERAGGNQTQAGRLLGLNRDQIRYRVEKFGLNLSKFSKPAS